MLDAGAFTEDSGAAPAAIAARVERFGLARIPGWLTEEQLGPLRDEFQALLADRSAFVRPLEYPAGRAVALTRTDLDAARHPHTARVFGDPRLAEVCRAVYGPGHRLNEEIWLTRDEPREDPINELHFDRIPSLKFFLYLRRTAEDDGALRCVPGSHHRTRAIARYHLRRGRRVVDLPNFDVPADLPPSQPITGDAGCLVVFSTDVYHQGGRVAPGHERWVMRGHSRPDPPARYHPTRGSRQWWRESPWNPLPPLLKAWDRITGTPPPVATRDPDGRA